MNEVCVRARYVKLPKYGLIQLSYIDGSVPKIYNLVLFDDKKKVLTMKYTFKSVEEAIGHASLYGFSVNGWEQEKKAL